MDDNHKQGKLVGNVSVALGPRDGSSDCADTRPVRILAELTTFAFPDEDVVALLDGARLRKNYEIKLH
jgi:hypothetical protein